MISMTEFSPLRVVRLLALFTLGCTAPLAVVHAAEETAAPAEAAPPASKPSAPSAEPSATTGTAPSVPETPPASPAPPPVSSPPLEPAAPIAPIPPIEKPPAASSGTAAGAAAEVETTIQWQDRHDVVQFVGDVTLRANERAHDVVVFGGDATIDGQVTHDTVVFGGDARINGQVRGELVVFGGDIELGPKAVLGRQVVVIGGEILNLHGRPVPRQEVIGGFSLGKIDNPAVRWVRHGLLKGRLLVPDIGWPWVVFGAFALLYLLIAALFPRGIAACVESIEERPAGTVLASFLMLFVLPLATLLLVATVVGLILVPFLFIGLLFAGIFGKASLATFLGRSLFRGFGLMEPAGRVLAGLGLGIALLALLYVIPVVGLLTWILTAWYGLGVALFTIVKRMRREKAATVKSAAAAAGASTPARRPLASARPAARSAEFRSETVLPASVAENPPVASAAPITTVGSTPGSVPVSDSIADAPPTLEPPPPAAAPAAASMSVGFVGTSPADETPPPPPVASASPQSAAPGAVPPVLPTGAKSSAFAVVNSTSPRADFWPRLGALVIDIVLVAVVVGTIGLGEAFPFLFGAYSFAMWLWRGTTIGGVVFSLKIVRLDDRPVDPATVLVRVLVGYISLVMGGLGFLWCAWDPEQQTWHDKVAGTVVVRAPKGMSLV